MGWSADSVQGVIFVEPGSTQPDALALWSALFGGSPDAFAKPRGSPTLQSTASGDRDGYSVVISSQTGRVDFTAGPIVGQAVYASGSPSPRVDDVPGLVEYVRSALDKIASALAVIRLAIVVDTAATALPGGEVDLLKLAIPPLPIPSGARDAAIQFNVRKPVAAQPGLTMNRLAIWNMGEAGFIAIGQQPGMPMAPRPIMLSRFAGAKFDVNTLPEQRVDRQFSAAVIREIAQEATALWSEGWARIA